MGAAMQPAPAGGQLIGEWFEGSPDVRHSNLLDGCLGLLGTLQSSSRCPRTPGTSGRAGFRRDLSSRWVAESADLARPSKTVRLAPRRLAGASMPDGGRGSWSGGPARRGSGTPFGTGSQRLVARCSLEHWASLPDVAGLPSRIGRCCCLRPNERSFIAWPPHSGRAVRRH